MVVEKSFTQMGTMMLVNGSGGLKHHEYDDTGLKNLIDGKIICTTADKRQNRTECFDDDHFPCRKYNCNKQQHVWNWLK